MHSRYSKQIYVHPDATTGEGYYASKSNWSGIYYNDPRAKYPVKEIALGDYYVCLEFQKEFKKPYSFSKIEGGNVVDLPESFDNVELYLEWLNDNGIITHEHMIKELLSYSDKEFHKVIRNNQISSGYAHPGFFIVVSKESYSKYRVIRYSNAKRCYQAWAENEFTKEQEELYNILTTIPDLTYEDLKHAGITDFA